MLRDYITNEKLDLSVWAEDRLIKFRAASSADPGKEIVISLNDYNATIKIAKGMLKLARREKRKNWLESFTSRRRSSNK